MKRRGSGKTGGAQLRWENRVKRDFGEVEVDSKLREWSARETDGKD